MNNGARSKHYILPVLLTALMWFSHVALAVEGKYFESYVASISNRYDNARYDTLLARVQQRGRMRVIAILNVNSQIYGTLSSQDRRARIATNQAEVLQRMAFEHLEGVKRFESLPFLALEVNAEEMARLRNSTDILSFIEDRAVPLMLAESIPLIGAHQTSMDGYSGAGQTVAILDTGVDPTHPALVGKVVAEACFSTNSQLDGIKSLCPNGAKEQIGDGAGHNCEVDGCGHGTHVAGIAAGNEGVARDANVISVQVFSKFQSEERCAPKSAPCIKSFISDQMKGLEFITKVRNQFKVAAVNMSLGGGKFIDTCDDEPIKPLIDSLRARGIATVVASGNEGNKDSLSSPACVSSAVSVGATTKGDVVAGFSNSANFLDLLAPGVGIVSAVPGGGRRAFNGTSMAAPHVAGAWAVLKGKAPQADVDRILPLLRETGVSVTDNVNGTSKPRIKLDDAMVTLVEKADRPDPKTVAEPLTLIGAVSTDAQTN